MSVCKAPARVCVHARASVCDSLSLSFSDRLLTARSACDLTTGAKLSVQSATGINTGITITAAQLTRTTVLHVEAGTAGNCKKLPSDVWLPEPGYNFKV